MLVSLHQPMVYGTLIKRYKRFLADIKLDSGELITAHCPNPGRMLTCSDPGSRVRLSLFEDAKRKYPYRLDLVHNGTCWIGVNPNLANNIVASAIHNGYLFPDLNKEKWLREVPYAESSRIDFLHDDKIKTYVEVKSVTYAVDGIGYFPDAISKRATEHLKALQRMIHEGHQSHIVYCVQRPDIVGDVRPAVDIDPNYASAFNQSLNEGVQVTTLPIQFDSAGCHVLLSG